MSKINEPPERAAFEKWFAEEWANEPCGFTRDLWFKRDEDGSYSALYTECSWDGWKARASRAKEYGRSVAKEKEGA